MGERARRDEGHSTEIEREMNDREMIERAIRQQWE